jgi:hypothetical protein
VTVKTLLDLAAEVEGGWRDLSEEREALEADGVDPFWAGPTVAPLAPVVVPDTAPVPAVLGGAALLAQLDTYELRERIKNAFGEFVDRLFSGLITDKFHH